MLMNGQCQANPDILIFHQRAPIDRLPLHFGELEFIKLLMAGMEHMEKKT